MFFLKPIKQHLSFEHCAWLVGTLLIFIFINTTSHPRSLFSFQSDSFPRSSLNNNNNSNSSNNCSNSNNNNNENCIYGRVYVYELPPILNKDLIETCDQWAHYSRCNALANGGFGPLATGLEPLVPANLTAAWYWTDLYAGEIIYHNKILNYRCRTLNPDEATAFYIPSYVGLTIDKYLWINHTAEEMDFNGATMLKWVENQDPWKRKNGSDHFIMLGRLTWAFRRITADSNTEWGTSLLNMPLMKNVLHLIPERSVWDELEISVPYPNPFHPRSESDICQWQSFLRSRERRGSLFSFVGGTRNYIKNDFRGLMMNYCRNASGSCRAVDCSVISCYQGTAKTLEAFLESDFCLQPKGDGFTRRATFDCMLMGGIPVFFWNGSFENQYQWHLPASAKTYSVFVDHKDVRDDPSVIGRVLEKFGREEVKKMRETVIDLIPNIVISTADANMGNVRDAFDISMDGVLRRFQRK